MKTSRILPIAVCTSALMFTALTGCSKTDPKETSDAAASHDDHSGHSHDDAADTDIVRSDAYEGIKGEITSLPVDGVAGSSLMIRHEHIPNFRTKAGEINVNSAGVSGMRSMTMEFPPADGLSLEGLAVGDKVVFTFVVNWGGERAWEVTAIEKLGDDAVIDFSDKVSDMIDSSMDSMDMPATDEEDHSGHDHP